MAVCRSPLRGLSQTEKSGEKIHQFISRVFEILLVAIPSLFMRMRMIHFLLKVSDWFAKWECGSVDLRVGACSSFWITKLFEFFALRIV